MAYLNTIKALSCLILPFIERRNSSDGEFTDTFGSYDKVEHFILTTKSGVVMDIQPQKGVVRKILANSYRDSYTPVMSYGWKGNKFIVSDGDANRSSPTISIYDPVTGSIKAIDMSPLVGRFDTMTNGYEASPLYRGLGSSDGHIMGSTGRVWAVPSNWRLNTETDELEWSKREPMPKLFAKHAPRSMVAFIVNTTGYGLEGVYHNGWWDDNGDMMFNAMVADATASGITILGTNRLFIHDEDRAMNSPKRRVLASMRVNGSSGWHMIDLKNPSVYYKSPLGFGEGAEMFGNLLTTTFRDVSNNLISTSGWIKGNLNTEPFKSASTIPQAIYSASFVYSNARVVGRFGYSAGYMANKTFTFTLPIALQDYVGYEKGDIVIPTNWDPINYATSYYNNGSTVLAYLCNFQGQHGFGNEDEYVGFINHPTTMALGFINPVTLEFITYNPALNSNKTTNGGFIVRGPVNIDRGEFGSYFDDLGSLSTTMAIEGDEYYYDNLFNQMKSAIKKDFLIKIDSFNEVCDISFTIMPDKTKPWQKYTGGLSNIPTTTGRLLNATELGENKIMFAGIQYAGITLKQRQLNDTLTDIYTWTDPLSYKGSLRLSDTRILYYGYMSRMDLIDVGNYQNLDSSLTKVFINNVVPEVSYASKYTDDIVFISGLLPRTAGYMSSFGGFGYTNLLTKTSFTFPNLPNELQIGSGQIIRSRAGLTASSYTDQDAETKFAAYLTTYGLSRSQGINNFMNTVSWSSQGLEAYQDDSGKFILPLRWGGVSALTGIRINEQANGSGLWHTSNTTPGIKAGTTDTVIYPKAVFVNKPNKVLSTLQSTDYKFVTFTELANKIIAGRLVITDNYIVFLDHDAPNSQALARVVSKANFEAAANGNGMLTFDDTISIPLNNRGVRFGFGSQGGDYDFFTISGTPRNSYFNVGDYIFVTFTSDITITNPTRYQAVIRINLVDGTFTDWCLDPSVKQAAKGITYNPTTDTAFYTRDSTTFRIPNFTTLTPPYTLV